MLRALAVSSGQVVALRIGWCVTEADPFASRWVSGGGLAQYMRAMHLSHRDARELFSRAAVAPLAPRGSGGGAFEVRVRRAANEPTANPPETIPRPPATRRMWWFDPLRADAIARTNETHTAAISSRSAGTVRGLEQRAARFFARVVRARSRVRA